MATNKKLRKLNILSLILIFVMIVCSSVAVVFASTATEQSLGDYIKENSEFVHASGFDPNSHYFKEIPDLDEQTGWKKARAFVYLATERNRITSDYKDKLTTDFEAGNSRSKADALLNEFFNGFVANSDLANQVDSVWVGLYENYKKQVADIETALNKIKEDDKTKFNDYVKGNADKIKEEYQRLKKANDENPSSNSLTTVGFFDGEQLKALEDLFNCYVDENGNLLETLDSEKKIFKDSYNPLDVVSLKAKADEIKTEAVKKMKAVPRNKMEIAIDGYEDQLNKIASLDKNSSDYHDKVEEIEKAFEPLAKAGIKFYKEASPEVKNAADSRGGKVDSTGKIWNYAHYNHLFEKFVDNRKEVVPYEEVLLSTLKAPNTSDPAITITAKYSDGTIAEVIPEHMVLDVSKDFNGSAKRNARNLIKSYNKQLSGAYFMYLITGIENPENGIYSERELPTTDKDNKKVNYEVKINLARYYQLYLEEDGIEKDKIKNIESAQKIIEDNKDNENLSLCYSYKPFGGGIEKINCTLDKEGGTLVFTTQKLNNICVAGANLESLITNPIFWVIVVACLILLIIIIKIIVKNIRYSVKFITNGGSEVGKIKAAKNEYFVLPAPPTKPGFVFAGWFTDKDLKNRFIETYMRRRKSIKLYAKWASPVTRDRLIEMYEILRDTMRSFKKESFKSPMGLTENELLASMVLKDNHLQLNLAVDVQEAKKIYPDFVLSKEKKFADAPVQLRISTENMFENALKLTQVAFTIKGLQKQEDYSPCAPSTKEERKNGFAYFVHNDRVAESAEDYFELLRIAIKSYVLENECEKFKPGDKVTLARIYITNEVACLHLPIVKGEKNLNRASRDATFKDTPVVFRILTSRDMVEAYHMIDKVMIANGFTRCPENANNLTDVKIPATNGFAYTLKFE